MSIVALLLAPPALLYAAAPPGLAATFPLGVYWPWERTEGLARRNGLEKWAFVERCLDNLKADGFDAVWAVNLGITDLPGLAERMAARGMMLVPALGELHYNVDWRRNHWAYLEKESKRALKAAGGSSAILAWALCDEPRRDLLGEMETFRRKFMEWGAKQPAVVVTMWPDSPTYAEQAGFGAVCTDVYPFFSTGNPNGPNTPAASRSWYRRHAGITAESARKAGRPPWIMPQCFVDVWGPWKYDDQLNAVMLPGAVLHWRQPTAGECRWQVWSAVGAGVRGFFWYVYLPPPADQSEAKPYQGTTFPPAMAVKQAMPLYAPGGMIRPDGKPTPEYLAIAETLAALKPLVPLLSGALPAERPIGGVSSPGWIGVLDNPALNRTFVAVVNDDTDHEQTLKVRLLSPRDVRDLRSGQVLRREADDTVAVRLGPGDGMLLEEIR
ncbi:MAG: hypothetical protein HUU20_28570 [Pirellulales bacterium]|nr:hypothetical protein [Pirellulales bacterium]